MGPAPRKRNSARQQEEQLVTAPRRAPINASLHVVGTSPAAAQGSTEEGNTDAAPQRPTPPPQLPLASRSSGTLRCPWYIPCASIFISCSLPTQHHPAQPQTDDGGEAVEVPSTVVGNDGSDAASQPAAWFCLHTRLVADAFASYHARTHFLQCRGSMGVDASPWEIAYQAPRSSWSLLPPDATVRVRLPVRLSASVVVGTKARSTTAGRRRSTRQDGVRFPLVGPLGTGCASLAPTAVVSLLCKHAHGTLDAWRERNGRGARRKASRRMTLDVVFGLQAPPPPPPNTVAASSMEDVAGGPATADAAMVVDRAAVHCPEHQPPATVDADHDSTPDSGTAHDGRVVSPETILTVPPTPAPCGPLWLRLADATADASFICRWASASWYALVPADRGDAADAVVGVCPSTLRCEQASTTGIAATGCHETTMDHNDLWVTFDEGSEGAAAPVASLTRRARRSWSGGPGAEDALFEFLCALDILQHPPHHIVSEGSIMSIPKNVFT